MGFRIARDEKKRNRVAVFDEPHWVIGMGSLSTSVSSELGTDVALVVAFSIWSILDRELAYNAIEIAKDHGLTVRIGLLPYDYPKELSSWLPNTDWDESGITVDYNDGESVHITIGQYEGNSPLWFIWRDGKPQLVGRGPITGRAIHDFLLMVQAAAADDVTE